MTCFTPNQLADLNTRSQHLIDEMRRLMAAAPGADVRGLVERLRGVAVLYGRPGVAHMVRGWLDQVIDATPGAQIGAPAMVMFTNGTFTAPMLPEHVTNEYRWVAEALAARLADDQVHLYRLIEAIPPGPDSTVYLMRALEVTAAMLTAYERPGSQPFRPGMYHLVDVAPAPA